MMGGGAETHIPRYLRLYIGKAWKVTHKVFRIADRQRLHGEAVVENLQRIVGSLQVDSL